MPTSTTGRRRSSRPISRGGEGALDEVGALRRYHVFPDPADLDRSQSCRQSIMGCCYDQAEGSTLVHADTSPQEYKNQAVRLVIDSGRTIAVLILPHVGVPYLASVIPSRITRRLSHDWQAAYGYIPVLAETFVDAERFAGTCYRATNWIHVGIIQGRGRLDCHRQRALPGHYQSKTSTSNPYTCLQAILTGAGGAAARRARRSPRRPPAANPAPLRRRDRAPVPER